jgi:pilus assembly protein CpaE
MAEKILIVDDDMDTLKLVGLMLQKQGYAICAASNGALGLAKALEERPDLILLDVMMPDMDGYEVTRRLRKNPVTAAIPILMFTAKTQLDDKVTGFEAGADDYLTKPTHPNELQAHVRALLARAPKKEMGESLGGVTTTPKDQRGCVIGILAARGGLGVSTIAVNLAAAIYSRMQAEVLLAEFTPGQGTLGLDLGVPNQKGLTELLQCNPAEVTREKVQSALLAHSSGIKVLLASENPRDVTLTAQTQNFEAITGRLATLARFVILDLGAGLPFFSQKILPLCSERLVVVEGFPNSIYHSKLLVDSMAAMQIDRTGILVILNNRQRSEAQLPAVQTQELLGHPVTMTLTPAPELFLQAIRTKMPAVITQPSNMTSQQFIKMADTILEREKAR